MKIFKLNNTQNVFKDGNAVWKATFYTEAAYMKAIAKMYESFGPGSPYTNNHLEDSGHPWMFRNMDPSRLHHENKNHQIYLTVEEQITFLELTFLPGD